MVWSGKSSHDGARFLSIKSSRVKCFEHDVPKAGASHDYILELFTLLSAVQRPGSLVTFEQFVHPAQ